MQYYDYFSKFFEQVPIITNNSLLFIKTNCQKNFKILGKDYNLSIHSFFFHLETKDYCIILNSSISLNSEILNGKKFAIIALIIKNNFLEDIIIKINVNNRCKFFVLHGKELIPLKSQGTISTELQNKYYHIFGNLCIAISKKRLFLLEINNITGKNVRIKCLRKL